MILCPPPTETVGTILSRARLESRAVARPVSAGGRNPTTDPGVRQGTAPWLAQLPRPRFLLPRARCSNAGARIGQAHPQPKEPMPRRKRKQGRYRKQVQRDPPARLYPYGLQTLVFGVIGLLDVIGTAVVAHLQWLRWGQFRIPIGLLAVGAGAIVMSLYSAWRWWQGRGGYRDQKSR